jgi:hypothetical protein
MQQPMVRGRLDPCTRWSSDGTGDDTAALHLPHARLPRARRDRGRGPAPDRLDGVPAQPLAQRADPGDPAVRGVLQSPAHRPPQAGDALDRVVPHQRPGLLAAGRAAAPGADRGRARRAAAARPRLALRPVAAPSARQHQLAARREPRHRRLPAQPPDLPGPARHLLGPDPGDRRHQRRGRRADPGRGRPRQRVQRAQDRPDAAALGHGHRLQRLAVRPRRLAHAGLFGPPGEPGRAQLLQRAGGMAFRHHAARGAGHGGDGSGRASCSRPPTISTGCSR